MNNGKGKKLKARGFSSGYPLEHPLVTSATNKMLKMNRVEFYYTKKLVETKGKVIL